MTQVWVCRKFFRFQTKNRHKGILAAACIHTHPRVCLSLLYMIARHSCSLLASFYKLSKAIHTHTQTHTRIHENKRELKRFTHLCAWSCMHSPLCVFVYRKAAVFALLFWKHKSCVCVCVCHVKMPGEYFNMFSV